MKHHLPLDIEQKLIHFVQKEMKDEQYSIILFGSYVTGKLHPGSDIDIAIKTSGPLSLSKWAKIEFLIEESELLQEVDVIDFHRVSPEFQQLLVREGITLYSTMR